MEDDGAFWEIASGLDEEEHRTQALDFLAAERQTFADALRRVPAGEVVTLVTIDGSAVRGRVLTSGDDYVRLGEVNDAYGTARGRVIRTHDVRLATVARIIREPEW